MYAIWFYHRFCLSFRDVEEILAERGVGVSDEAVRPWCLKFGAPFAKNLGDRRGRLGDIWHLDEMFVSIRANNTIYGMRSIRMEKCWIFGCKSDGTPVPRSVAFTNC